jgi:prepilin peptidase CpaA
MAMQLTVLIVAVGVLGVIAYSDIRNRRIPNALSLAVAALGLARIALAHDPTAAGQTLTAGAVVFAVALLLFWRGVVGGGDAKLIASTALLVGHQQLLSFLFLMSLCGGMLAAAALVRNRLRWQPGYLSHPGPLSSLTDAPRGSTALADSTVPYGVAIAAAGMIVLILDTCLAK